MMLAVWGDFDSARMKAQAGEALRGLDGGASLRFPRFPKVDGERRGRRVPGGEDRTSRRRSSRSGIWAANCATKITRRSRSMADILGGGFHSRLVQTIRTKMGNAYDISATWGAAYDHPGLFEISGSTNTPSTVETIDAV